MLAKKKRRETKTKRMIGRKLVKVEKKIMASAIRIILDCDFLWKE